MAFPTDVPPTSESPVALIGTGAAALAMLWRLRAAGVSVRWFCGNLDVAEEALLASAPPGSLELVFADPREAKLGRDVAAVVSAAGSPLDDTIAACAHDNAIAISVIGRPDLSTFEIQTAFGQLPSHPGRRHSAGPADAFLEHAQ